MRSRSPQQVLTAKRQRACKRSKHDVAWVLDNPGKATHPKFCQGTLVQPGWDHSLQRLLDVPSTFTPMGCLSRAVSLVYLSMVDLPLHLLRHQWTSFGASRALTFSLRHLRDFAGVPKELKSPIAKMKRQQLVEANGIRPAWLRLLPVICRSLVARKLHGLGLHIQR